MWVSTGLVSMQSQVRACLGERLVEVAGVLGASHVCASLQRHRVPLGACAAHGQHLVTHSICTAVHSGMLCGQVAWVSTVSCRPSVSP